MRIVFVGYVNRSGSTLLLSELNRVRGFVCLPESELLAKTLLECPYRSIRAGSKLVKTLDKALQSDFKLSLFPYKGSFNDLFSGHEHSILSVELFTRFITQSALSENPGCTHVVYKNTHLPFIYKKIRTFERVKYSIGLVNLVRDPRAVFLSQKQAVGSWNRPMGSNALQTALEWRRFVRSCDNIKDVGNAKVINILYEDLVNNPNQTIVKLLQWLDVTDAAFENPLSYIEKIPHNLRGVHLNIAKGVIDGSIQGWREGLPPDEVNEIEWVCKDLLLAKGYGLTARQTLGFFRTIRFITAWIGATISNYRGIHLPPQSQKL